MKQGLFRVAENRPLSPRVSRLILEGDCSGITAPGQFISIALPGFFLRRPFSVCDWSRDTLSILYETVGCGTEAMRRIAAGEKLDLLTGLGNGFDLHSAGERPLLIGGGTGISPLYGLAKRLNESGRKPELILGFGSQEEIFYEKEFCALGLNPHITTEDGSRGIRGFVTEAMDIPHSFFYACGPEAMLRSVCKKSPEAGELSFDARMGCGFGACMGCSRKTKGGSKRVCRDGPVFRKEEILWED